MSSTGVCVFWIQGEGEVDDLGEESEDEGTGLLTIYEVTRDRAGFYKCTADNGVAPPGSVEGQLIVRCEFCQSLYSKTVFKEKLTRKTFLLRTIKLNVAWKCQASKRMIKV